MSDITPPTLSETPKPCDCPIAGFCERHGINKPPAWHRLCQKRDEYREAWDAGVGPGQEQSQEISNSPKIARTQQSAKKAKRPRGVGTHISVILHAAGITAKDCGCHSKAAEWNRRGVDWCLANRRELVDRLVEQAAERDVSFLSAGTSLATAYPLLSARIGLAIAMHPLRATAAIAGEIVDYAIHQADIERQTTDSCSGACSGSCSKPAK